MKWSDIERLELDPDEWDLLFWNVANEVINGFKVNDFEKAIGASEQQVKTIANHMRAMPKNSPIIIDRNQALIFRNALAIVLKELGIDEFHTRTGCDFELGRQRIQQMDQFLGENSPEERT